MQVSQSDGKLVCGDNFWTITGEHWEVLLTGNLYLALLYKVKSICNESRCLWIPSLCGFRFVNMRILQKKTTRVSGWWWCWYCCWCWRGRMGGEGGEEEGRRTHEGRKMGRRQSLLSFYQSFWRNWFWPCLVVPSENWKHDVLMAKKLPSNSIA